MVVEIVTPQDYNDLFTRLKNFISSLTGWTVDAQSSDEIYFHNQTGHYGIALKTQATWMGGNLANYQYLILNSYDSYDETKDFLNQPNSSNYNVSPLSSPDPLPIQNCIMLTGIELREIVMCGDEKNLIIIVEHQVGVYGNLIITEINKSHNFEGGKVMSSTNSISSYNATQWIATTRYYAGRVPFNSAFKFSEISGTEVMAIKFYDSYYYSSIGVGRSGNYNNIDPYEIITNIPVASNLVTNIMPFNVTNITGLNPSQYTGLNPLITPEFYYRNDENKYIYAGNIDKIKLTTRANFTHKQRIFYGEKEYLILEYSAPSPQTTYLLAIEL